MRLALPSDQALVVSILTESFQNNPSVLEAIKKDHKINDRIRELAIYAFKTGLLRNGVYISSDEQCTAICYQYNIRKEGLKDYRNQIRLLNKSIGFKHVFRMLKKEGYLKKQRPKDGDFLYFWFFGASDAGKGQGGAYEIANGLFELSQTQNKPIYLETSVPKNMRVYKRFGFEIFHTWERENEKPLYFMRKTP